MTTTASPPVLDCAGSGLEIGRAHGEQARDAVRQALERWRERTAGPAGRSSAAALVGASPLLDTVRRLTPAIADELRGIAEGAGVPFADVVAYNCMDEQWWMQRHDRLHGCSVIGAWTAAGGHLTQNMDLPPFMDGSQVVLRVRPDDGPAQLLLSAAGLVGLTGVNEHGVAVCVNTLGMLRTDPRGLPVAAVIRSALGHRTRTEAVAFLHRVPHASGQHYAVGDGDGLDSLECSAGGTVQVPASVPGGVRLAHTNHPLTSGDLDPDALREVDQEGRLRDSRARLRFLADRLGSTTTRSGAEALLADDTVPIRMPGTGGLPLRTFGTVSYRLGEHPHARFRLGGPVPAGDGGPWLVPGWHFADSPEAAVR
ncbi:C45 family autoproteolytic acyltransferase/hydrolase [Streptomyces sp. NPDC090106]|uniref:C45 family autoproteolytic acyltransferase/hydolase n=1 Tax=Streptomyces sp. NPDC090106 TaxID=3365946 RepID=UPI00381BFF41